ncbi:MAG: prepilin-type N-terminal cleavage/methylation domain-containing protein [Candidatus Eremiobacteraeota bacterium]|nr:prepilin-type N-terminal cleavage/methylation domain-containing protein [Candidatus Eremiobacteraeota bacterium]MCW5867962.1 prepilin-type N-terminal cleavage/methylation domain-containing protein [Candidatus Eremiobacteraeota bacterium]
MRRAFTLIETLIAAFTLALVLAMVVMLLQQYLRVTRQADGSLRRVAPRLALLELAEEARLALSIDAPPAGGQGSQLVFQRLRPAAPPVEGSDPWPASRRMTVRYSLDDEELWRRWEWPGQAAQRELVAAPVKLFLVSRPDADTLVLRLDYHQEKVRLWRE